MSPLKVFICHKRNLASDPFATGASDEPLANAVKRLLLETGEFTPWLAEAALEAGTVWEEEIYKEILGTDVLLVLVGQDTSASQWVQREITLAKALRISVFPIAHALKDEKLTAELKALGIEHIQSGSIDPAAPTSLPAEFRRGLREAADRTRINQQATLGPLVRRHQTSRSQWHSPDQEVRGLSRLYGDVYSLFEFQPNVEPASRGEKLLDELKRALDDFCRENKCSARARDVMIFWTDTYVAQQGRALLQTHQAESPLEYLTHSKRTGEPSLESLMSEYAHKLETRVPDTPLPSLTTLHLWAPSASFWVLGNPRNPDDKKHTTLTALFDQFADRRYADEHYKPLVRELDRYRTQRVNVDGAPEIVNQFLRIVVERYCDSTGDPPLGCNLYHVPKYGVALRRRQPTEQPAALDFEAILVFDRMTWHPCVHYLARAIHLFLDLLSSYLFHFELRSSASKLRVMQIEEQSILHNLSYAFDPKSTIDGYVRSRLQFVSQYSSASISHPRPAPLSAIFERLAADEDIYTGLLKANIRGARVCVDPAHQDTPTIVMLPGGVAGINLFRVVIENIIRNAAKHATASIAKDLEGRFSHLKLTSRELASTADRVLIELDVPLYDGDSIHKILKAFQSGTYLLNDLLEPASENMGSLEILLCCLAFLNLSPELLIGENAIACKQIDIGVGWDVFVSDIKVLELRRPRNRLNTISFRWEAVRGHAMAVVSSHDRQESLGDQFRLINPKQKGEQGIYPFLVGRNDEVENLKHIAYSHARPRCILLDIPTGSSSGEILTERFGTGLTAYVNLWLEWRHIAMKGPLDLLVIGANLRNDDYGIHVETFPEIDVRIHFVDYFSSIEPDGREYIENLTASPHCVACLLHGAPVPLPALESIGAFDNADGLVDGFIGKRPCPYAILGWKEGRSFPSLIENLMGATNLGSWRNYLLATLVEQIEAWYARVLVIDERSEACFGDRGPGDHEDGEGLPEQVDFQASWSYLGVDIVYKVDRPGMIKNALARGYDYILIHNAFLVNESNASEVDDLREFLGADIASKLIVHSDGSTFTEAKPDLFTLSWTDVMAALGWGSKLNMMLLISNAIRYNKRFKGTRGNR